VTDGPPEGRESRWRGSTSRGRKRGEPGNRKATWMLDEDRAGRRLVAPDVQKGATRRETCLEGEPTTP